jgi:hypothetical protein
MVRIKEYSGGRVILNGVEEGKEEGWEVETIKPGKTGLLMCRKATPWREKRAGAWG